VMTWGEGEAEPAWDLQMEVNELPRAFRTTLDSLPVGVPYVRVSQERIDWAAKRFPQRQGKRIGVIGRSGPWDSSRSIPAEQLAALSLCADHQYFNLQEIEAEITLDHRFQDMSMDQFNVRDLAATMMNLDLIITVDTMAAHLAGALGLPVWILLPFRADWRWMLERRDTPWYPTARLFRQTAPGDWSGVTAEVARSIAECGFQSQPYTSPLTAWHNQNIA
jgi:ADP-heptose:LPS heptosyltransferase